MRHSRRGALNASAILLIFFFSLCGANFAATATEPPQALIARAAIKSPRLLLERLDEFAAAATAGRRNEFPAGTINLIAEFYLPLSLDSFDSAAPAQILFLSNQRSGAAPDFVLLLSAPDFTALLDDISDRLHLKRMPVKKEGPFLSLHAGGWLALAELPGGKAALYSRPELAEELTDFSWIPEHDGDSLLFVEFPLRENYRAMLRGAADRALTPMKTSRETFLRRLRSLHVSESAATGLLDLVSEYAPGLFQELEGLEHLRLHADLDGEKFTFCFAVRPGEASILARAAEGLEAAGPLDLSAMKKLPPGAVSVGSVLPPTALVGQPDAERLNDVILERIFPNLPELTQDASAHVERFYHSFEGKNATASFLTSGGGQVNSAVYYPADPETALRAFQESINLQNRFIEAVIEKPEYRFRFAGQPVPGADGFTAYRLEFANNALMRAAMESIDGGERYFTVFENLRLYAGVRDGAMVILSGSPMTDADATEILAQIGAGGESADLAGSPAAKAGLAWLTASGAQAGLSLLSAERLLPLVLRNLPAEGAAGGGALRAAILDALPIPETVSGEAILFAAGSADGELELRAHVSAGAVNVIARDAEAYEAAARRFLRESQEGEEDGGAEEPEFYYEEEYGEEHEEEEEEENADDEPDGMMLDAPAEAS